MRSKKVTRYWCDHCNKGGLQPHAMAKHERHCTLNPARTCRVCTIINGGGHVDAERMPGLIALLPAGPGPDGYGDEVTAYIAQIEAAMPKLREATENCPACILAALRQAKIHVGMVSSFDFSGEMKTVFANIEPRQGYDY